MYSDSGTPLDDSAIPIMHITFMLTLRAIHHRPQRTMLQNFHIRLLSTPASLPGTPAASISNARISIQVLASKPRVEPMNSLKELYRVSSTHLKTVQNSQQPP